MSHRGPAPMPASLRVLTGNPSRRPLRGQEPAIAPGLPDPPPDLTEAARAEWDRVGPLLAEAGLVTPLDRAVLVMYVETWSLWRELDGAVKREGITITRRAGPGISPVFKAAMETAGALRLLAVEIGMTPAGRSRLRITPPPAKTKADLFREQHDG